MAFALAALATGGLNAAEVDFTFTEGTNDKDRYPIPIEIEDVTFTYDGGVNTGNWFDGNHIRIYATDSPAGNFTVSVPEDCTLTSITLTEETQSSAATLTTNVGTFADNVWTGSATSVTFTSQKNGDKGKQYRLAGVHVVYDKPAEAEERVEAPTFSVAGGLYTEATDVTISCATAGATIHYAVNGEAEQTGAAGESVVVPLAEDGTYAITAYATAEGMRDSETAEATYTINTALANAFFIETFDKISGTGGNDGKWSGNVATSSMAATDVEGWTFMNTKENKEVDNWGASQCVKLGTGSAGGSATTPALEGIGSYAVMTFKAGSWSGDGTTLNLSISGGGQLSETSFQLPDASWENYTVYIENATAASKVTFANSGPDQRFFLDEVVIANEAMTQLVAPGFSGVAEGASYWDEATVEIACATEGATINYTVTKDDVAGEPVTGAASPVSVKLTEPGRYTVTATASKDSETSEEASISFTIAAFPYDRLDPNGEIKEGTYMIVAADETGQYYMMKNAVQSNFYVQATVFDFEAGVPTTDETCLFFVEKADGGYYIKNFDQTYVSLVVSGTHTNLKPAEETPFVWTFSGTKDAVVATGTEITVPMGYDINFNNFAADADDVKPMFIYVNNETSGVEETMAGGVAVAGVDGAIAVAADEAVSVAVYTAAGQLAVSTEVAAGTTELSVAPGFYIVKAGDVVKKVIVK